MSQVLAGVTPYVWITATAAKMHVSSVDMAKGAVLTVHHVRVLVEARMPQVLAGATPCARITATAVKMCVSTAALEKIAQLPQPHLPVHVLPKARHAVITQTAVMVRASGKTRVIRPLERSASKEGEARGKEEREARGMEEKGKGATKIALLLWGEEEIPTQPFRSRTTPSQLLCLRLIGL